MSLQNLVELLRQSRELSLIGQSIRSEQSRGQIITGLSGSQRSAFLSTIYDPQRVMLVVTGGKSQAEKLAQDLQTLLPESRTLIAGKPTSSCPMRRRSPLWTSGVAPDGTAGGSKPGTIVLTSQMLYWKASWLQSA